ncbi:hypothetical protein DFJ63DRAFT_315765 [Scheffersomyces coipomensis]|uniref:uncharacterized protein n=1 Tax=Scheffersomyces coipomensis TaxID=1788519 RepID=UPI00315D4113
MSKVITNPATYSQREILLLSQLLYVNNLQDEKSIDSASDELISTILTEFKNHVVMKLDNKQIKLNTKIQLKELYSNLLAQNGVNNTEDLANTTYFGRMDQLNQQIAHHKQEFVDTLQDSKHQ